ncbi:hypothetical protein MKW98_031007 [Papaver atlanticum]|uniref:Uncharacterized protein n=1 Tax=Papaver atlanticum TaxID=357466 RepID=A0AAD4S943_9MAGN|nr:hypothetical protein MKW98_031007 [Papaver atlanticum]
MAILRRGFRFFVGTTFGIYVAQNYNVPNIKKVVDTGLAIAKRVEENHRKQPQIKKDDE